MKMDVQTAFWSIVNAVKSADAITLTIGAILFFFCLGLLAPKPPEAKAYHILVEKRETLEKAKGEINGNLAKFQSFAKSISTCPSGKAGGDLGWFKKGAMVPPFDNVVWDYRNKTGQVYGPIRTQFGWHLIYLAERKGGGYD